MGLILGEFEGASPNPTPVSMGEIENGKKDSPPCKNDQPAGSGGEPMAWEYQPARREEMMSDKNEVLPVEGAVIDTQDRTLLDRVCDYLNDKEWSFTRFEDRDCLVFNLRLRDGGVRVIVDIWEGAGWSRILVYAIYPTFVPEHRRPAVCEAIARINYANILGCFEMDMADGEVRARTTLESDVLIGEEMIDRAIRKSLDLADQYQAALLSVAFGNASAKDVLEMGARDETDTVQ